LLLKAAANIHIFFKFLFF